MIEKRRHPNLGFAFPHSPLPYVADCIHSDWLWWLLLRPLSAAQLPFEPNPIRLFATYLGKEAWVGRQARQLQNLSALQHGSGNPKTYQCESGDAVLTRPEWRHAPARRSPERADPAFIWTAGN